MQPLQPGSACKISFECQNFGFIRHTWLGLRCEDQSWVDPEAFYVSSLYIPGDSLELEI